jgi:hypothetical protein
MPPMTCIRLHRRSRNLINVGVGVEASQIGLICPANAVLALRICLAN